MPRRAPLIALAGPLILLGGCFTEAPILMPVIETGPGTGTTEATVDASGSSASAVDDTAGDDTGSSGASSSDDGASTSSTGEPTGTRGSTRRSLPR